MDLDSALTGKPAEGAGATELLRADHREVERLFAEYAGAHGAGQTREVIAQSIAMQLELHDIMEREVFYPAVLPIAERLVEEAMREHDEIAMLLEEIKDVAADDAARVDQLVTDLRRAVEAHVRDEEQSLFPRIEEHDSAALREPGLAIVKRKEELTRTTGAFEGPAT